MHELGHTKIIQQFPALAELYIAAFAHIPQLMYIVDKNCAFIDCNQNLTKLMGTNDLRDHSVGSLYVYLHSHAHWSEERVHNLKKDDIKVILSATAEYDKNEAPILDGHGGVIYLKTSRIPLFDDEGHVQGLLVMMTDISEQKKFEEQYEKMKQQLQAMNHSQKPAAFSPTAATQRTSPPRILLVEDNLIAQKAAQAVLMQTDCLVDVADGETQLKKLFEPGKYDLIFMDIGLENTSGYVLAKDIRQQEKPSGKRVPIIALTGYEADVVQFDCDYYQMEGAITKPLTLEQVRQIIQHYIYDLDISVSGLKHVETK